MIDLVKENYATPLRKLRSEIKTRGVPVLTIQPVIIEFLKGVQAENKFKEKKLLVGQLVDHVLPYSPDLNKTLEEIAFEMGQDGNRASYVDLILGAYLKKFKGTVLLLTKNLIDFPAHVYERIGFVSLLLDNSTESYGLYRYGD